MVLENLGHQAHIWWNCPVQGHAVSVECSKTFILKSNSTVGNVTVLQRPRTVTNEQHNNVIAGSAASYANSRTPANSLFPNWEQVHPLHDRLIKKSEVRQLQSVLQNIN